MGIDSIRDLLETIDALPPGQRGSKLARLEAILYLPERQRQVAIGLLALDLAPAAADRAGDGAARVAAA